MRFDVITLFPESIRLDYSIIGRAIANKLIELHIHDLRQYGLGNRRNVDDKPFGGGPGMVMLLEPVYNCLKAIGAYPKQEDTLVLLTSAKGRTFDQKLATSFVKDYARVVIICGHYEGVDERVVEHLCDMEISIGNYVLSGGELPAMVMIDAISRLKEGVLGNPDSLLEESHSAQDLDTEYPQYTRPAEFVADNGEQWTVPDILLSGHHAEIEKWRKQ